MTVWMNTIPDEARESVMERARVLCTCGAAGIPPNPWPCGGHLRAALDEWEMEHQVRQGGEGSVTE